MPVRVVQHVGERVPHLLRRAEDVRVVAIREHASAAMPAAVEPPSQADAQPLHAVRQSRHILRLADQMQVVGEDRELHQAEPRSPCAGHEGSADDPVRSRAAQALEPVDESQRDVHRMS